MLDHETNICNGYESLRQQIFKLLEKYNLLKQESDQRQNNLGTRINTSL